jgi:hypothetical protein
MGASVMQQRRGAADMRPCDHCGVTNPQRMLALMALWFAEPAGLPVRSGYFYLCPDCYRSCVGPRLDAVLHRLAQDHPGTHRP